MDGDAYRSQLADTGYPALASTFICSALLAEVVGRRGDAGWAYLHAAWTLDDASNDELARLWRGRAADAFLALLTGGHSFVQQPGASEVVVTDCLRRARRGAEAIPLIERALSQSYEDVILKILALQRVLIQRGDTSRHLIEEALENRETTA